MFDFLALAVSRILSMRSLGEAFTTRGFEELGTGWDALFEFEGAGGLFEGDAVEEDMPVGDKGVPCVGSWDRWVLGGLLWWVIQASVRRNLTITRRDCRRCEVCGFFLSLAEPCRFAHYWTCFQCLTSGLL
jgi:hypothetical protein